MWRGSAFVLLVAAACGQAESRGRWAGTIDTLPSGTIVVSNPATGIWDSAASWSVVEELRIGTAEGEGPASLDDPAIEVDPAGRIWILDRGTQDIRVFAPNGAHVRTIGRRGRGPGEYQQAVGMAWDPVGRLWVMDQRNVRYTVLDTAGHVVADHTRPVSGFFSGQWLGGLDTAGRVYEYLWGMGNMDRPRLLRFGVTLKNPDTIPLPRDDGEYFEIVRTSMRARYSVPYAPSSRWMFDPRGYLWFGKTAPYRIYQQRMDGDTVRIIERVYTPLAVTGAEKDSAVAGLKSFVDQGGSVDRGRMPDTKPALDRFFPDDRGNLWVDPVTSKEDDHRIFDVFDPDGRYLGAARSTVRLMSQPVFRGDVLYAVTQDDDGIPYVVRARIVRPISRP